MRAERDASKEIVRGTFLLLLARTTFFTCGLVTSVLLARILGPVGFGVYGVVFTLVTWLQVMLAGGISGATTKVLTEHPDDQDTVEHTALTLLVSLGIILYFLGYAVSEPIARFFAIPSATFALRIAFLDVPLMALVGALQGALYARARYGLLALSIAAHGLLKAGGIATLAVAHSLSIEGAFLVHVAASLFVLLLLLVGSPPRGGRPALGIARALLRRALPLACYGTTAQLHGNLPFWLLAAVLPASPATGLYVAALNVSRTLTLVPAALSGVVFGSIGRAKASRDEARARDQLASALRLALLLLAPALALVVVEAEPLVTLIFGQGYREAAAILRWQMLAFAFFALLDVLFSALFAAGLFALPVLSFAGLLLSALLLSVVLIASFGALGAAAAHAATMALGLGLALLLVVRTFRACVAFDSVVRIAAAALGCGLLSFFLPARGFWLVGTLALSFAFYVFALVMLGQLRASDVPFLPTSWSLGRARRASPTAAPSLDAGHSPTGQTGPR